METYKEQDSELIFALDIGTRSIVGVVGKPVGQRLKVLAVEIAEHGKRVMMDGQIDDIGQVAALAKTVTQRLESQLEVRLRRVCVAAAGRALRTMRGAFSLELIPGQAITQGEIGRLEAGAVAAAEEALMREEDQRRQLFLVGYTVAQYRLDNYPLQTLLHHNGQTAEAEVVATFLPGEVVESLYAAMNAAGLQVASMTLEPIAAMNAAIPADLRLLNLALVDIGAGTTDIAICREGSVVGYTMVTVAGDEITEAIMKALLVDFQTGEQIKRGLAEGQEKISYTDILGVEEETTAEAVFSAIGEPVGRLADAIAQQVLEINGGPPSALFLAGGGSKLATLRSRVAQSLGMDDKRVAIAGNNFAKSAFSDQIDLNDAEYATPLGIAVSAGMGLLNDSYVVTLNGLPAKLFRSGALTLQDILLMNGYASGDLMGRTGASLAVTVDGQRRIFRGEPAAPAILEVNGQEAAVTTLIHAGDEIRFVPAKHGASASLTLGQLLGEGYTGGVLVNNQEASLDQPLNSGDVVLTGLPTPPPKPAATPQRAKPVREPTAPRPARPSAAVRQTVQPPAQPMASAQPMVQAQPAGQPVTQPAPAPAQVTPAQSEQPPVFPVGRAAQLSAFGGIGSAFFGGAQAQPAAQPPALMPTAQAQQPVAQPAAQAPADRPKMQQIYLNKQPLALPPKADGEPYYLMDLLEYTGIDFRALDRPVRLEVNGEESDFQRVIRDRDAVTIAQI